MMGPFVGREREMAQVVEGLQQITRGRGALFLVSGEPGIGKTRLADAIARHAEDAGASVRWGRCWEGDVAPSYWPWTQVFDAIGSRFPSISTETDSVWAD